VEPRHRFTLTYSQARSIISIITFLIDINQIAQLLEDTTRGVFQATLNDYDFKFK